MYSDNKKLWNRKTTFKIQDETLNNPISASVQCKQIHFIIFHLISDLITY